MRIDPKNIPGLRDLPLDAGDSVSFDSALPSMSLLQQAWGSADLRAAVSEAGLGEAMVRNAASATRWAQGIGAVTTGVPQDLIPDLSAAVGSVVSGDWRGFATGAALSAMDIGLEAMGCVPVVGWAARVAVSVVDLIIAMSKDNAPKPPNLQYDREVDEWIATDALRRYYDGNATSVFMPPADPVDGWSVEAREPGFSVEWRGDRAGIGVIPGAAGVCGAIVSDVHWGADNWVACNASGRSCWSVHGSINKRTRAYIRRDWDRMFAPTVQTVGAIFPSALSVGGALWSAVTSTRTAAAFEVKTIEISSAWSAWCEASRDAARSAMNGGVRKMYADRYVGYQALQRSVDLAFYGGGAGSVDDHAKARCQELRRLQFQLLNTLAVAYCSEDQPAFEEPNLRQRLRERRAQLLGHSARWDVSLDDVPDVEYREQLRESRRVQDRFVAAGGGPGPFTTDEPKRVSPLDAPGGQAGGGALAFAVAGVLTAGLALGR